MGYLRVRHLLRHILPFIWRIYGNAPNKVAHYSLFGARTENPDELEASEVQDLAEVVGDLMKAAAGQRLRFKVTVELGESTSVPQGVVDEVNNHLANIKTGWKL